MSNVAGGLPIGYGANANSHHAAHLGSCTILIVDDDPGNLGALGRMLRRNYQVLAAPSGERALEIAAGAPKPDLILLDVMMPDMDGHAVIKHLRENPATRDIPVIFVTRMDSSEDEAKGLELGAVDYIAKPYSPPIVLARVHTHLELKHARDQNANLEVEVARRMQELLLVQDVTINALAELAETRDSETGYHIHRTQAYMRLLTRRLHDHPRFSSFLTAPVETILVNSAPLHDIGKVGIPDQVLLKPGKLSATEWAVMKTHSLLGARAIERALSNAQHRVEFLDMAMQIARSHHEKWDGSGYPDRLRADAIPIPARLMALADVFDALISRRVYKEPIPADQARDIIAGEAGGHFDPDIVDAFLADFHRFVAVAEQYREAA